MRKTSKPLIVAMCALVAALGVNATYAWLTDTTEAVTNTFEVGNVNIALEETDADKDGDAGANAYKMVPGQPIAKDPVVTVEAGSEDCWLFVEVDESDSLDGYIAYAVDGNTWTELDGAEGVYWCLVEGVEADCEVKVLGGGSHAFGGSDFTWEPMEVLVKPEVTKQMMDDIADGKVSAPTLTFTAYAVQKAGFDTPAEAWKTALGKPLS